MASRPPPPPKDCYTSALTQDEYEIIAAEENTDLNIIDEFIPNELLLFGYTREIEQNINVFTNIQTPLVVIQLIQSYFDISFNYQYILVSALKLKSNWDQRIDSCELIIHELETKKNLEIKFSQQNNNFFWKVSASEETAFCGISNLSIPEWIQQKDEYKSYFNQFENKYNRYHIIAGCDSSKCGFLTINTETLDREMTVNGISNETYSHYKHTRNKILSTNAKWINLPALRSINGKPLSLGSLMAKRYNLLYLGGREDETGMHSRAIYILNWSDSSNLRWKMLANKLCKARCKASGCLIYEKVSDIYKDVIGTQKLAIIGGYDKNKRTTLKSVELLSFNKEEKETIMLDDMRYGRSECGVCTSPETNKRIIVGGGDKYLFNETGSELTSKSVEMYDINVDKWQIVGNLTRYTHRYKPSLWVLPSNPNIVYIAGDFRRNNGYGSYNNDIEMGTIEFCDLRECQWHRHGDLDLFKLRDVMRFKLEHANYCPVQVTL